MRRMIFALLAASLFLTVGSVCRAQSKEELKKKYENSDLSQEINKKLATEYVFPDSIVLPPLHFTNSVYQLDSAIGNFQSISIDVEVVDKIPDHYHFYISPFNLHINNIPLYCGIQTAGGGIGVRSGQDEQIRYNGIFSRWYERTEEALQTEGYYASSDAEGDFISVRNIVGWNKGAYRITLKKEGYVPGKPIGDDIKDTYFGWGDYEHTWVGMYVENLETNSTVKIGALAFPGKTLSLNNRVVSFTEQYKYFIDFAEQRRDFAQFNTVYYKDLPRVRVVQRNLRINGKPVLLPNVLTYHNRTHHPEQHKVKGKMPLLSSDRYDAKTGDLSLETGVFNGWVQ